MTQPNPMVSLIATTSGDLACDDADGRVVWRVDYVPEPWAWTPWQYATGGRFTGRWDDPDGMAHAVGRGQPTGLLPGGARGVSCRPELADQLHDIDEDPADTDAYPTAAAGALSTRWREPRLIGSATLAGWYVRPARR